MARKTLRRDAGTVVVLEHHSKILADNPLGDPSRRKLAVWLPPRIRRCARAAVPAVASRCCTTWWVSPDRASRT